MIRFRIATISTDGKPLYLAGILQDYEGGTMLSWDRNEDYAISFSSRITAECIATLESPAACEVYEACQ